MIERYISLETTHSFCVAYTILTMWGFVLWLVYNEGKKSALKQKGAKK